MSESDAVPPRWYQKPEMLISLSAMVCSLMAVLVGVYSAYID